jgi:outer membrane protein assembly factor BamB
LAPKKRLVNIMDRLMSAWPLGGGVVTSDEGIVYTAAGSTAADGAIVAAVDIATGQFRWCQRYTLDRPQPQLSFGVQGNILLQGSTLYINGGAPVGIVALDATTGANPRIAARLEAGRETFLEPDGRPFAGGPELFSDQWTRTTIFKRHQGRVYFASSGRHVALIDGRLFCSSDPKSLDRIVARMNQDPRTGGRMGGDTVPRDVMRVSVDDSVSWAGRAADVIGLAVAANGLVALHRDRVEALSMEGQPLWTFPLKTAPVRWGIALAGDKCIVTLSDGQVICLTHG